MAMAAQSERLTGRIPYRPRPASPPAGRRRSGGVTERPKNHSRTATRPEESVSRRAATAAASQGKSESASVAALATGFAVTAVTAAWIFGLVLLNIYVAQTSFRLSSIQKEVTAEQNRYRQMRYQVSLAESPVRLADVSRRLGLVIPEHEETLPGPPAQFSSGDRLERALDSESRLKGLLAIRP